MAGDLQKKGMKILQITNKVPVPPKDGGSIASFRLAEGLAANGQDVHILAMNTSKHFVERSVIDSFERDKLKITAVFVNTRIKPLKALWNLLFSKLPYNAVRFVSREFRKKLLNSIFVFNPDVIILENLYPALYINDIRAVSTAPVAYRAHNLEYEIWKRSAEKSRFLKKGYLKILARRIKQFETGIINEYDILVPITKRDSAALDQLGNKKPSYVLPTGFPQPEKITTSWDSSEQSIAQLGALDWLPNQEGLIWFIEKVLPIVRKEKPDLLFHLAGRNAPAWFEKKIKAEGVVYHGEIEKANEFIQAHQIHIVPLFSGSGMRIKILEAMAMGKTIITTSLGTEGIETENNQNILIADNQEEFSKQILRAVEDPAFCREIGENAYNFVTDKLNNNNLVRGLLDFLKERL